MGIAPSLKKAFRKGLCRLHGHAWDTILPDANFDFLGCFCVRCGKTEVLHRDNVTRRQHYQALAATVNHEGATKADSVTIQVPNVFLAIRKRKWLSQ